MAVIAMVAIVSLVRSRSAEGIWPEFLAMTAATQPVLLLSLITLCGLRRSLAKLPYSLGIALVVVSEVLLCAFVYGMVRRFFPGFEDVRLWQPIAYCLIGTVLLLFYLDLRARALSPAIAEARLQALQARIRPHFLFNSITAVLSLIRDDPRRAEQAMEDMADLFRVLMADNRQLAPLENEVTLCRQYLDLEQLRLGERLKVVWHTDNMPRDALVPPLVLQPLLENAVYHGIEPATVPGEISIDIFRHRNQVIAVLRNPYHPGAGAHHGGNKMALANIRERLALHFDAEASLKTKIIGASYQVTITLPYTTQL